MTTNVALSLPEPSGGTLLPVLTKLARSVPESLDPVWSACHEIESGATPVVPFRDLAMLPSGPPVTRYADDLFVPVALVRSERTGVPLKMNEVPSRCTGEPVLVSVVFGLTETWYA